MNSCILFNNKMLLCISKIKRFVFLLVHSHVIIISCSWKLQFQLVSFCFFHFEGKILEYTTQ